MWNIPIYFIQCMSMWHHSPEMIILLLIAWMIHPLGGRFHSSFHERTVLSFNSVSFHADLNLSPHLSELTLTSQEQEQMIKSLIWTALEPLMMAYGSHALAIRQWLSAEADLLLWLSPDDLPLVVHIEALHCIRSSHLSHWWPIMDESITIETNRCRTNEFSDQWHPSGYCLNCCMNSS